jgi:copper homeostasis protein
VSRPLVEAAVETVAHARLACEHGAARIELCESLEVAGLTPRVDLIRDVRAAVEVPLHVLIRPRPGSFVYDAAEVRAMCRAVQEARRAGADGVVVGALTRDGAIDRSAILALREAAGTLPMMAHRAVDAAYDLVETVEALASLGVVRVLTSGGAPTAEEGLPGLRQLVTEMQDRIVILAGGWIRPGNAARIVAETGVREIHVGFPVGAEMDRVRGVVAALS